MKYLIPSLANFIGAVSGMEAAYLLTLCKADYAIYYASQYGLNVVATSVLIGSCVALVVSFIVTHVMEHVTGARK